MKKNDDALVTILAFLFVAAVMGSAIWGWALNIVKLAGSTFDPLTGIVLLRCIGIFMVPLGSVLGYIG